ncbi:hypothetical protein HaLaN_19670 [Haematococcus lacustris]|uniref:Uncharacterized protein n=1 Tax=Haematococcus lacustris TaxID=44745 RepID=A0A699ZRC5_HAELA|nr:hypothetical protein HaLaN_19670 [Haematococcus lacustris]
MKSEPVAITGVARNKGSADGERCLKLTWLALDGRPGSCSIAGCHGVCDTLFCDYCVTCSTDDAAWCLCRADAVGSPAGCGLGTPLIKPRS